MLLVVSVASVPNAFDVVLEGGRVRERAALKSRCIRWTYRLTGPNDPFVGVLRRELGEAGLPSGKVRTGYSPSENHQVLVTDVEPQHLHEVEFIIDTVLDRVIRQMAVPPKAALAS